MQEIQISMRSPKRGLISNIVGYYGSVEVLEFFMALFLLKTGTFSAKNWQEISVDVISCFVKILFRKEKGKYTVTLTNRCNLILPRIQHKVVLLVLRTVFAIGL